MSTIKYILDTNVFINLQKIYPLTIFDSLWKIFESLLNDGIAISSIEVFKELHICNDDIVELAERNKHIFFKNTYYIYMEVRDILKKYPKLVTGSKKSNNADPFVIALAKKHNCTLVSSETRAGKDNPEKIPNVCDDYKIRYITFIDFLRENKVLI
ncbi:MAG: DUF4411 family protein [Deltaproteobacteria bacterium]|nr:DUF4411 family protein [Deltaproteobacteria bacterium]